MRSCGSIYQCLSDIPSLATRRHTAPTGTSRLWRDRNLARNNQMEKTKQVYKPIGVWVSVEEATIHSTRALPNSIPDGYKRHRLVLFSAPILTGPFNGTLMPQQIVLIAGAFYLGISPNYELAFHRYRSRIFNDVFES